MIPKRWHVYTVDLNQRVGSKPGKRCPCVAVQPTEFAEAGLSSTVILPLTTRVTRADAHPLRVRLPGGTCGLASDSDVLVDHILAWDNTLFREELGLLPEALQITLQRAMLEFLDLD